jgi:hypothetical protein
MDQLLVPELGPGIVRLRLPLPLRRPFARTNMVETTMAVLAGPRHREAPAGRRNGTASDRGGNAEPGRGIGRREGIPAIAGSQAIACAASGISS